MQIKSEQWKVSELLDSSRKNVLTVNPEYQRGHVWSIDQKRRLIDSVFRRYPLPLVYLHEKATDFRSKTNICYQVIDGQQRINALRSFEEGTFSLYDPAKDEKKARFPSFIKNLPCAWGGLEFKSLPAELKTQFLQTEISVALISDASDDEARDLFIRLQAGMPLNAQEKRDAWPGGFTEFVLKRGGKPEIDRYPGHEFFRELMGARKGKGRGKYRAICAQLYMLFDAKRRNRNKHLTDIRLRNIDDYYYQHLDFDADGDEPTRFVGVLTKLTNLLGRRSPRGKNLKAHEAMHLVLFVDSLLDDYVPNWESKLAPAYDQFMAKYAAARKHRKTVDDEFWTRYGAKTRGNADTADIIEERHAFFCQQMLRLMPPLTLKDPSRTFNSIDREYIYYRDMRICAVCTDPVDWTHAEIHHVEPHSEGGNTSASNGKLVHDTCHPRGKSAQDGFRQAIGG